MARIPVTMTTKLRQWTYPQKYVIIKVNIFCHHYLLSKML
jgi:hypothetical protein